MDVSEYIIDIKITTVEAEAVLKVLDFAINRDDSVALGPVVWFRDRLATFTKKREEN
jgi:hypothetical protein